MKQSTDWSREIVPKIETPIPAQKRYGVFLAGTDMGFYGVNLQHYFFFFFFFSFKLRGTLRSMFQKTGITIALDGPAGSGKSTTAREVANVCDFFPSSLPSFFALF
jgi:hypothetical protein